MTTRSIIGGPCPCGLGPVGHGCDEARRQREHEIAELGNLINEVAKENGYADLYGLPCDTRRRCTVRGCEDPEHVPMDRSGKEPAR